MKFLNKIIVYISLMFAILPINQAFAYITDENNMGLARQVIATNPSMKNHFMNMSVEEFGACAATSILMSVWEVKGEITLNQDNQLMWAVITVGAGLARQNLMSQGYPDEMLGNTLKYKGALLQNASTQTSVMSECTNFMASFN